MTECCWSYGSFNEHGTLQNLKGVLELEGLVTCRFHPQHGSYQLPNGIGAIGGLMNMVRQPRTTAASGGPQRRVVWGYNPV